MKVLLFIFCAAALALAQSDLRSNPYVFRISHETQSEYACALLQRDGAFHLEFADGEKIKVFEGTTSQEEVLRIEQRLNDPQLAALTQGQIEEPLVPSRTDELDLTIYRGNRVQDLLFQTSESAQRFKRSVQLLIHWLDELHKLPHREFSEDEGMQHCLPRTEIALKRRDPSESPMSRPVAPKRSGLRAALTVPPLAAPTQNASTPASPLLRVYSFSVKSDSARQFCALIGNNGMYRFENRAQKSGKPVSTSISSGQIDSKDLSELHVLLDKPELANVRHGEPRGNVVPVMGDMLALSIARPDGVQNIILSSGFGHEFGTFYGGDADIVSARELMKFLKEHIENNKAAILDKSARNDCTEAP